MIAPRHLDLVSISCSSKTAAENFDILFITENTSWGKLAYETILAAFPHICPVFWSPGMPKPDLSHWHGDWIISFKSDLILSRALLNQARNGAINIHPSPPKYRGLGGYWWALHNNDKSFGVTCHHMDELIDHGSIVMTEIFPIWPKDTEDSLKQRTAIHALGVLNKVVNGILNGSSFEASSIKWGKHLYTHKELVLKQKELKAQKMHSALKTLNDLSKSDLAPAPPTSKKKSA